MGRPRTRPPTPEPKATQQKLRKLAKAWKEVDEVVPYIVETMIGQLYSIQDHMAAGDAVSAERVRRSLDLSSKKLAQRIKRGSH